jgi:adenine/guanine phosphoribosyltransferase-like PRPP-binding protein
LRNSVELLAGEHDCVQVIESLQAVEDAEDKFFWDVGDGTSHDEVVVVSDVVCTGKTAV